MPRLITHPSDAKWAADRMRFRFVVDCQALAGIITGLTPLQDETFGPVFRRMTERLDVALRSGWRSLADWADPVVWREREWNQQADFLANLAMDSNSPRRFINHHAATRLSSGNVLVFSDGGLRRANMVASSGWIAFLPEGESATTLAYESLPLTGVRSAFFAEMIGLDRATSFFDQL